MTPSRAQDAARSRRRVRCVLHGDAHTDALASTAALLRGIAALYGDGLDIQADAGVAAASGATQPPEPEGDACRATITLSDASDTQQQQQDEVVELHGQAAITQWMKTLLESRLAADRSGASTTAADGKENSSSSKRDEPIRIFVSGDRSQVGKSTVCLGLVGALLRHGFAPEDVGYIKPATQCEQPQLVAKFCRQRGVACCDIGPIVFYSGFTREFLKGNTEPPAVLLAMAKAKVDEIGRGRKVVIVDGVGYPAVGSICGVSNAAVAFAVQAPVVLVGKRGVGDAVDSFNLNACFFESQGVDVLGALFNRLPRDGYYSLANCRESVSAYFDQFQPHKRVYGFIPEMEQVEEDGVETADVLCDGEETVSEADAAHMTQQEAKQAKRVIDTFYEHVDLTQLLEDAKKYQSFASQSAAGGAVQSAKRAHPNGVTSKAVNGENGGDAAGAVKRSRADIQAAAKASGAAGS